MKDTNCKDLIVLSSDKNTEFLLNGLLSRHASLSINPIEYHIIRHPQRDAGCLSNATALLRQFVGKYNYSLIVFDREGCGKDHEARESLELSVENEMRINGWDNNACAIVVQPEIDMWIWTNSVHMTKSIGWSENLQSLYAFLQQNNFILNGFKPDRPKEAFEFVLRHLQKPRSSSLYKKISSKSSFSKCTDLSFLKLINTLQRWFPLENYN